MPVRSTWMACAEQQSLVRRLPLDRSGRGGFLVPETPKEERSRMGCGRCGFENPWQGKFCEECGTTLVRVCPSCGQQVRPTAKFCGQCGTTLGAAAKPLPAKSRSRKDVTSARKARRSTASPSAAKSRPAAPEAERRQLT